MSAENNARVEHQIAVLADLLNEVVNIPVMKRMTGQEEEHVEEHVAYYNMGRTTGGVAFKSVVTAVISERITELTNQINTKF